MTAIAVILSGGGARSAYEAGVLSILLPALEEHDLRPQIFVGSSGGAINAVAFAALGHLPAAAASEAALDLWREVHARAVFESPLGTVLSKVTRPAGRHQRAGALLDTTPLAATLDRLIDWDRLHANIAAGRVAAVGVVATSSSTRTSTVFVEAAPGAECPPTDRTRAIDYVSTTLDSSHVLASSAIPILFPSVRVDRPPAATGWYFDGGIRLNTPIKPAIKLGAERVVVVATSPADPPMGPAPGAPSPPPGVAGAGGELLYAVLDDRMVEDLRVLGERNVHPRPGDEDKVVPWLFGGPPRDDASLLGRLVVEVLGGGRRAPGRRRPLRSWATRRALHRFLAADPSRAEFASHLFFDPDFIEGAIGLGRRDGRRLLGLDGAPVWQDADRIGPAATEMRPAPDPAP